MTLRVVAIGDLHVGSLVGLCFPDETSTQDPGRPTRDALYARWQEATSGAWKKPDVLIVNGDTIDGKARKSGGIGTWTVDTMEQADQAAELIKMWQAERIFVVRGSPYHVEDGNVQVEEYVARQANAEPYPNQDHAKRKTRNRSGWHWYINLAGITFHVAHKVGVSRVFHYRCYSEDTEVLTESGWKPQISVQEGEKIAVYSPTTEKLFFEQPKNRFDYDHTGEMIEFTNKTGSSICVTPNHRMWCQWFDRNQQKWGFRQADKINGKINTLMTAPIAMLDKSALTIKLPPPTKKHAGRPPINEDLQIPVNTWCEFLGYYLSGGGREVAPTNNHLVTFAQKKPEYVAKMEDCFNRLGIHYTKTDKDMPWWVFNRKQLWEALSPFGSESHLKHIPREIFTYPPVALQYLFDAMLLGDGSIDSRTGVFDVYYTSSLQLAHDFQELATRLGYPSRVALHYLPKKPHHHAMYRVYLKSRRMATLVAKTVNYSGKVSCFEVSTGLYLTRRPGYYPTVQGNTTPLSRELLHSRLNDLLRHEMAEQRVRVVLRSHAHYYLWIEHSGTEGCILPCWKALDDWMLGRGALDISPDIGYIGMTLEDGKIAHEKVCFPVTEIQPAPYTIIEDKIKKPTAKRRSTRRSRRSN